MRSPLVLLVFLLSACVVSNSRFIQPDSDTDGDSDSDSDVDSDSDADAPSDAESDIAPPPFDPAPLFAGVAELNAPGAPGPVSGLDETAVPIIAGDEDSDPAHAVVGVVNGLGLGRVVALGHGGFFSDGGLGIFDNFRFAENTMDWLVEPSGRRTVFFSQGHEEWMVDPDDFSEALEEQGFTVDTVDAPLTTESLSRAGVLIVGVAWGAFTMSEINAVTAYVDAGGGLLMLGVGWSWIDYRDVLERYPMNHLGAPFGIGWLEGTISDPTDQYDGSPVFHTFYPSIPQ